MSVESNHQIPELYEKCKWADSRFAGFMPFFFLGVGNVTAGTLAVMGVESLREVYSNAKFAIPDIILTAGSLVSFIGMFPYEAALKKTVDRIAEEEGRPSGNFMDELVRIGKVLSVAKMASPNKFQIDAADLMYVVLRGMGMSKDHPYFHEEVLPDIYCYDADYAGKIKEEAQRLFEDDEDRERAILTAKLVAKYRWERIRDDKDSPDYLRRRAIEMIYGIDRKERDISSLQSSTS